jgi:hypothetical protein
MHCFLSNYWEMCNVRESEYESGHDGTTGGGHTVFLIWHIEQNVSEMMQDVEFVKQATSSIWYTYYMLEWKCTYSEYKEPWDEGFLVKLAWDCGLALGVATFIWNDDGCWSCWEDFFRFGWACVLCLAPIWYLCSEKGVIVVCADAVCTPENFRFSVIKGSTAAKCEQVVVYTLYIMI